MTTKQQEPGSKGRVIVLSKEDDLLFKELYLEYLKRGIETSPLQLSSKLFSIGLYVDFKNMKP